MKKSMLMLAFFCLLRVEGKKISKRQESSSGFDLLPANCGHGNPAYHISEGIVSKPGIWPWLAALGYQSKDNRLEWKCGGALISSLHVLTAAHCVHNLPLSVVRLGEHDLTDDSDTAHEDFSVSRKIVHEHYKSFSYDNDVAILTLDRPVKFKDHISPICLPRGKFFIVNSLAGVQAVVAGWGYIGFGQPSSPVLKEAKVPIKSNEECKRNYAIFRSLIFGGDRLCAGMGGNDACGGDSGGPLMVWDTSAQRYSTVGIVSLGYRCGEAQFPAIYARVTEYMDWIKNNLKSGTSGPPGDTTREPPPGDDFIDSGAVKAPNGGYCPSGTVAVGVVATLYVDGGKTFRDNHLVCSSALKVRNGGVALSLPTERQSEDYVCPSDSLYVGYFDNKGPCARLRHPSQYNTEKCIEQNGGIGKAPTMSTPTTQWLRWIMCPADKPVVVGMILTQEEAILARCCGF